MRWFLHDQHIPIHHSFETISNWDRISPHIVKTISSRQMWRTKKISNYWMGSSLISYVWIINAKVWVVIKLWAEADNTNTRFNNLWYHAKTEFNNSFIVHFLNCLQKKILLSEFAQFENTTWSRGLDTRQTLNQYWVTMLTSHVIVGWLFGLNQSEFS